MSTSIELRNSPAEKWSSAAPQVASADGQLSIMFSADGCYSAWVDVYPDIVNQPETKTTVPLIPAESSYAPYVETGQTYIINACVNVAGYFRATIL